MSAPETKRRRILVLTGKRGGFGAMKPMLRSLKGHPRIELQLVVTDQHLDPQFGATISEVAQEFEIAGAVPMNQKDASSQARAEALGNCTVGMAKLFNELKPDICVIYGDRGEALATCVVAATMNIPIAHVQGGDLSGSTDEVMRHAITKLSQIHFPSIPDSARRIERLGEESWRIHIVGDLHLDCIAAGEFAARETVVREFDLDPDKRTVVILQHSETTAPGKSYEQMVETLTAVREHAEQAVVVYPCSDVGYEGVLRAIREMALPPVFRVRPNIAAPLFLGLLKQSAVLIGNSSSGLIETPLLGIPAINIGRRQEGRVSSQNTIHVGHDRAAISAAIERAMSLTFAEVVRGCAQPYGDGHSGERISKILAEIPLDQKLLVKRMSY
jgi:UDP-N-acetylglucosamine 2-epimerase (non-hydrolysing)/GDP/UDP-N,N'-diacetylbacillosamine 2-epimerase (hydrolysing)